MVEQYQDDAALAWLRGKVIFSDDSTEPVGEDDWALLKAERRAVPETKKRTIGEILDELGAMFCILTTRQVPLARMTGKRCCDFAGRPRPRVVISS